MRNRIEMTYHSFASKDILNLKADLENMFRVPSFDYDQTILHLQIEQTNMSLFNRFAALLSNPLIQGLIPQLYQFKIELKGMNHESWHHLFCFGFKPGALFSLSRAVVVIPLEQTMSFLAAIERFSTQMIERKRSTPPRPIQVLPMFSFDLSLAGPLSNIQIYQLRKNLLMPWFPLHFKIYSHIREGMEIIPFLLKKDEMMLSRPELTAADHDLFLEMRRVTLVPGIFRIFSIIEEENEALDDHSDDEVVDESVLDIPSKACDK